MNMTEIAIEIAKQVPSLFVLAWIVRDFIKSREKSDERFLSYTDKREERSEKREERVASALERNTEVMTRFTVHLERLNKENK